MKKVKGDFFKIKTPASFVNKVGTILSLTKDAVTFQRKLPLFNTKQEKIYIALLRISLMFNKPSSKLFNHVMVITVLTLLILS